VIDTLSLALVATTGIFLAVLGVVSLFSPSHAKRFLLGFAGSPSKHYAELAVRILMGSAFLMASPLTPWPVALSVFGWVLLGTTGVLLLVPWHWHHRFARRAVPEALRFLPLVGAASLVLGALVLWAAVHGYAA
jgi:uncharacterized protein YjeT (DUF2065 family)